jgi:hypothetical protein
MQTRPRTLAPMHNDAIEWTVNRCAESPEFNLSRQVSITRNRSDNLRKTLPSALKRLRVACPDEPAICFQVSCHHDSPPARDTAEINGSGGPIRTTPAGRSHLISTLNPEQPQSGVSMKQLPKSDLHAFISTVSLLLC